MHHRTKIFILLLSTCNFLLLSAQDKSSSAKATEDKAYTLKEAQDYAVKNSYQAKTAMLNVGAAEKNIRAYIGTGLPQVNAEGKFQNYVDIPTTVIPNFIGPAVTGSLIQNGLLPPSAADQPPNPEFVEAQFGTKYNVSGGINASQLIFSGTYFVGLQAAKTYSLAAKQGLEKSENDIRELVAQAYHTVLVAKENEVILMQSKKNLEKTLYETSELYKNGFVEEMSVEQLQLILANVENAITSTRQQVETASQILKFQMGLPVEEKILLKDSLSTLIRVSADESILAKNVDITNHPDFKLANTQERLMLLNKKAEKTKYLPTLVGFFNYQKSALRNEFNFTDRDEKWFPATLWGVSLQVPLFSGGNRYYTIGKAQLELEKTQLMKIQVEQGLKLQLQTARSEFLVAMNQYKTEKENLTLAEKIRNKTLIKYNQGIASSLELTQTENQYLATQGNYIRAMFQLLNSKVKMDKLMGNK